MGKVETYSSLEEKEDFFEQINIKTKVQLDEIIELYKSNENNNLIFRGCKKANYKLFNKAQREWISKELFNLGFTFNEFIKNEIKNARNWQDNLLDKFFTAFGQPANDLIILGFLQHYGAPTTLLDWTYNFDNSLFFATDGFKFTISDDEIKNYFSVYIIDNGISKISDHIDILKDLTEKLLIIKGNKPEDKSLNKEMLEFIGKIDYEILNSRLIALIPGYQKNGIEHEIQEYSFKLFYNQQNLNIINQQGLFIFNGSKDKPLEYYFQGKLIKETLESFNYSKIKCLNIHISLLEYTMKLLKDRKPYPIDRDFIFPQEELIAKNAFNQMLNFDYINNE